jgi:hypothetical protein
MTVSLIKILIKWISFVFVFAFQEKVFFFNFEKNGGEGGVGLGAKSNKKKVIFG